MMGTMPYTRFRQFAVLSLCLVWGAAYAQDSQPYEADPPSRAARLSFISGDVSLQPAGEQDWAPALINRPLTTGDKLWTEHGARAEIYVGPAAVRLDSDTGFSFLNVDDDSIQMRMTAGVVNVSVPTLEGHEQIEIDTPNVAISLLRAGSYRIEVNDAGDSTVVKVSDGAAQATGSSQDLVVHAQQAVTFTGVDDLVVQTRTLDAPDDFDSWSLERDRRDVQASTSRTAEYVAPDVTGYQDLDANGTWNSEPEYGYVWTPSHVSVGWAPYSFGRWVWVSPWGYTWIDNAPWGYAPFHYGRWAHVRNRWCWVPGPRHVRAVYAPALVGWVGSPGLNVSWFPLGPREVYMPRHRYSRHYVERVNVSNTIVNRMFISQAYENHGANINYRNRGAPGGVTSAPRGTFTTAGRIAGRVVRSNDPGTAHAPVSAVAPQFAPTRESRLGGTMRSNPRRPPQSVVDRQVVVRRDPPAAGARFARNPAPDAAVAQMPARPDRPVRSETREAPARNIASEVVTRDRQDRAERAARADRPDRPPRTERPASDIAPSIQSSVFDRQTLADRVRVDRDRQVREGQQREVDSQQRGDRQENPARQQREQQQQQQQLREMIHRQQTAQPERPVARPSDSRERPAQREREIERPRVEQRRVEQPRVEQPRVEQPRVAQPRVEQPRVQQPREERPRVERTETRSQPQERSERPDRSDNRAHRSR
jgi:FecR protein